MRIEPATLSADAPQPMPRRGQTPKQSTTPVGRWLDLIRDGESISYNDIAMAIGQNDGSQVNRWRHGKNKPGSAVLTKIAEKFPEYADAGWKLMGGKPLALSDSPAIVPALSGGAMGKGKVNQVALGMMAEALSHIPAERQIEVANRWLSQALDPHWLSGDNTGEPPRSASGLGAP